MEKRMEIRRKTVEVEVKTEAVVKKGLKGI
jgi:hypothetical protein